MTDLLDSDQTSPVFLHSSFRTSSTWLWQKIRRTSNVMAYYEVFHEQLQSLDLASVANISHDSWPSKHPLSAPYFLEFTPLLKATGGVDGFEENMSYDRFIPCGGIGGELSSDEKKYIHTLLKNAYKSRKIPVLSGTRSLGRAHALKKAFPFKNIFIHRNLYYQWASYSDQFLDGNSYFIDSIDRTIRASRHDPFISTIDKWYSARLPSASDERTFAAFIVLHLYLSAASLRGKRSSY